MKLIKKILTANNIIKKWFEGNCLQQIENKLAKQESTKL